MSDEVKTGATTDGQSPDAASGRGDKPIQSSGKGAQQPAQGSGTPEDERTGEGTGARAGEYS